MTDGQNQPHPNRPRREPRGPLNVAIVGMACRFPGARDLSAFWENVLAGRDSIEDLPPNRGNPADFLDRDATGNDWVGSPRGGFLKEPIDFDPTPHGLSPLAVEGGDPEQFLILDAARAAFEDAGLPDGPDAKTRVNVFIGKENPGNRCNLARLQHGRIVARTLALLRTLHPSWTESDLEFLRADLMASLPPFEVETIPGQWAERLNLSGACHVGDVASVSSLVALNRGARALVDRRADMALVGGVHLQSDADFSSTVGRLGALSRSGRARPFATSADGALPGEGVGVVVLKRLADAERDGDRVYAVIQAVGLASDGRGTARARGIALAIRRAYRAAGIDPATVALVEGHGLGVPASDRAELRALLKSFPIPNHGARVLGSLTALIGHAPPAAGIAGLIKCALALHHRLLPITPCADEPHELLTGGPDRFVLNRATRPWIHGDEANPRRAAVNAFGFTEINAHAVLEEHTTSADGVTPGALTQWDSEAILLGAADRNGGVALARALLDWLGTDRNLSVALKDLAFTLNTGQTPFPFRIGLVASSTADLRDKLRAVIARLEDPGCRAIRDSRGTYFWSEPLGGAGRLAFLFPGEGSQYPGMLADLCPHFPEVRSRLDVADRISIDRRHKYLPSSLLFDPTLQADAGLFAVGTAVNVVLSAQLALQRLLTQLGLKPDAVAGHSSGEFVALAASGVIGLDREIEERLGDLASVFERLENLGTVPSASLVAVAASREKVEAVCRESGGSVLVAMDNCPHQVVVAGVPEHVGPTVSRLRALGHICEELPFHRAYHTPSFAVALGPLRAFFARLDLKRPTCRLYSCKIAGPTGDEVETIRRLAVEQWVAPVAFRSTVEAMYDDGVRLFVEVGARGNLSSYVEDTLRGRPHFAIPANLPKRSGISQLNHLVAALYAQGVDLQPEILYARRRPRRIDLSQDLPIPAPTSALAVGFPELKFSLSVVSKFQSETSPARPSRTSNPRTRADLTDHPSSESSPNGYPSHSAGEPWDGNGQAASRPRSNGRLSAEDSERDSRPHDPPKPAPEAIPGSVGVTTTDAAMLSFFATMDAFLASQSAVMQAYLAGAGSRSSPESEPDAVTNVSLAHLDSLIPIPTLKMPVPAPEFTSADKPSGLDVAESLLEQVSRRTGYPREMLGMDLDMEADLGIDSIKRVEILGELHERGLVPKVVEMEQLSRCRTLGMIVALLERPTASVPTCSPAQWIGVVETFTPGIELVALRRLDAATDPVAAHHTLGGRRISALQPDRLGLPVVPFTVLAELLAQAAALLVPGKVVVGFRDLQATKWVRYEDVPFDLEVHAARAAGAPNEVHVSIRKRGRVGSQRSAADAADVEGVVLFKEQREPAAQAREFSLPDARQSRFKGREIYDEQWLFHGPALQAVTRIGAASRGGIEGTIRVLPRRDLLPESLWPTLHTDPIVLDAFTHILGCWGLDQQAGEAGDVMFPLRLSSLSIHGADPPEGAFVECHVRVLEITRHHVRVDADLVGPDGKIWVAIRNWEDWRFYWPGRYRDVFRMPDAVLIGEPLELRAAPELQAVWLEPPADMGKPLWRDVLEWVQLTADERRAVRALGAAEPAFTLRVWERIAAKEAARRFDLVRGGPPCYPADLEITTNADGTSVLRSLLEPGRTDVPAIAFAATEGVAVALAAPPSWQPGIAVEHLGSPVFAALGSSERHWLETNTERGPAREEWALRLQCAAAAARQSARGAELEFVEVEGSSVVVFQRIGTVASPVRCHTSRRGEYVLAWSCLEPEVE